MEKKLLSVIIFFLPILLFGQVQTGLVREINSGKKPVGGVQVSFEGAVPTTSDDNGLFRLRFHNKRPGDFIFFTEIRKTGYELVNGKDLEVLKISNTNILGEDIIVAKKGVLDAAKKLYYEVSDKALLASFKKEKTDLRNKLKKAELGQKEYEQQLTDLQEEFDRQQKSLEEVAEKFARVNFDDIDSLYKAALDLYRSGDIDGTIIKLEEADLIKRAEKILGLEAKVAKEKRETIRFMRLQADMYLLKFRYKDAEKIFDKLVLLDTNNIDNLEKAANFYYKQHLMHKAQNIFTSISNNPYTSKLQLSNAYFKLGSIHDNYGLAILSMQGYRKSLELTENILEQHPMTHEIAENLALVYEALSSMYNDYRKSDSALWASKIAVSIREKIRINTRDEPRYVLGLSVAYENYANIYWTHGDFQKAEFFNEKATVLAKQVYSKYPDKHEYKHGYISAYEKLAFTYVSAGKNKEAEKAYADIISLAEELYNSNKYNNKYKNGLGIVYEHAGILYYNSGNKERSLQYLKLRSIIANSLAEEYPAQVRFKINLGWAIQLLGVINQEFGQLDSALHYFEKMRSIFQELNGINPKNSEIMNGLGLSHQFLGRVYFLKKDFKSAITDFGAFNNVAYALSSEYKNSALFKKALAISYDWLAKSSAKLALFDSAIYYYENSLIINFGIYDAFSKEYKWVHELLSSIAELTIVLFQQRKYEKTVEYTVRSIEIRKKGVLTFPEKVNWKQEIALSYNNAAFFSLYCQRYLDAENFCTDALQTDSSQSLIYTNLALAYLYQGKWEQAKEIYLRLKNQPIDNETFKAIFLQDLKDLETAGITHPDVAKARVLLEGKLPQ